MNSIIKLNTIDDWEEIKKNTSGKEELVIFKYSPVCSVSALVEDDFDLWYSKLPEGSNLKCVKVNVISARQVSAQIAEELKIRHQSPQLIWLTKNSEIKWQANHYDITKAGLAAHF